jgi:pimeloyl-ACP methyl ester carboxylesterase
VLSRVVTAVVASAALLAGCTPATPAPPAAYERPPRTQVSPDFDGAVELPPPDMSDNGPGSLVDVTPVTGMEAFDDGNATAVKVAFKSTNGDGDPSVVTGVVVVPPGQPPKGGWPIISYGHAMTGTQPKCAPTLADKYWGYASAMMTLVGHGFVVAFPDFQGLGIGDGAHSVVDGATLGNNMIDAARAARRVLPAASSQWAAYGLGEGGLAAWAAAERAGTYGAGMDLVGAVAISPYANMSPLVDAAARGELTGAEQFRNYIWLLQSVANMDPDFDLDAHRSGVARDQWDMLADCAPPDPEAAKRTLDQLDPNDLRPRDAAAAADLRRRLAAAGVPSGDPMPGSAPVLVAFGGLDVTSPPDGIRRALVAACAKGERIEVLERAGSAEASNDQVVESAIGWLYARFAGERLGNVCVGVA